MSKMSYEEWRSKLGPMEVTDELQKELNCMVSTRVKKLKQPYKKSIITFSMIKSGMLRWSK